MGVCVCVVCVWVCVCVVCVCVCVVCECVWVCGCLCACVCGCVHCIYLKVIHSIQQWQILIQMSGLVEVNTMQHCNIMLDLAKVVSLE